MLDRWQRNRDEICTHCTERPIIRHLGMCRECFAEIREAVPLKERVLELEIAAHMPHEHMDLMRF